MLNTANYNTTDRNRYIRLSASAATTHRVFGSFYSHQSFVQFEFTLFTRVEWGQWKEMGETLREIKADLLKIIAIDAVEGAWIPLRFIS